MLEVLRKLNIIQFKLNAPKNQYNNFGKYKYRSCEDILEGVKPLLSEQGCVIVIADQIRLIGDRFYVEATATIHCCETGEEISSTAMAREASEKKGMDSAQVTGATSSYARKYCLNGLLAIDDEKDADSRDNSQQQSQQPQQQASNEDGREWLNEVDAFIDWARENGMNGESAVKYAMSKYKVNKKNQESIRNM